jgi:dihydropteroate synthase
MGVLNVTPDSFSDGGQYFKREQAIAHGLEMASQGADIIDVGGESTRPYAQIVSIDEELERVIPIISTLSRELSIPISIDTYKARVAHEALKAGASLINDISAFRFDPHMASLAAEAGVPVVLMHMKGTPRDMQDSPTYDDLMGEILSFLGDAVKRAISAGIREDLIIVDPGIGFGKSFNDNLVIIRDLPRLAQLRRPVLLGSSNKAFIGHILDKAPGERDTGTMASVAAGVINGADLVRVHNVQKAVETVRMIDAIKSGNADGDRPD